MKIIVSLMNIILPHKYKDYCVAWNKFRGCWINWVWSSTLSHLFLFSFQAVVIFSIFIFSFPFSVFSISFFQYFVLLYFFSLSFPLYSSFIICFNFFHFIYQDFGSKLAISLFLLYLFSFLLIPFGLFLLTLSFLIQNVFLVFAAPFSGIFLSS